MIHIITGGSGSGKSAYAENMAVNYAKELDGHLYYVATMHCYDEEGRQRVRRHRKMRENKQFDTIEKELHLETISVDSNGVYLIEDLSNWLANELYIGGWSDRLQENAEELHFELVDEMVSAVRILETGSKCVIIVTNEIFSDGSTYETQTETFRALLANLNIELSKLSQSTTEVVAGIPLTLKTLH